VSVTNPLGLAFDGTDIWAALNLGSGRAAKISGTGAPTVLGEFSAGVFPGFITFDGSSIWVSNSGSGNLTKLRAADGSSQGTFPGGGVNNSGAAAFDGTNLWVVGGSLLKLRPSDGQVLASFPITGGAIAFDGSNLWVTDVSGNTVTKH
jgi:DNA-binding beta-propeller fold protein YncE